MLEGNKWYEEKIKEHKVDWGCWKKGGGLQFKWDGQGSLRFSKDLKETREGAIQLPAERWRIAPER